MQKTWAGFKKHIVNVDFEIRPSRSSADDLVSQAVSSLLAQFRDASSRLLSGVVLSHVDTSKLPSVTLKALTTVELNTLGLSKVESSGLNLPPVVEFQESGLFTFEKGVYVLTEDDGSITLSVRRDHGIRDRVLLHYRTYDGTANALSATAFSEATDHGRDYKSATGILVFEHGHTKQDIVVQGS